MATAVMSRRAVKLVLPPARNDAPVQDLISAARGAPAPAKAALLAGALSSGLLWASFPPVGWSPLAWVALLPLLCLIRIEQPTAAMYRMAYLSGLCFWIPALQWMRLGHPTMYIAWMALAGYLACYTPAFLWMSRVAVHRLRLPLALAAPLVWTGLELLRGHLFTGFGWYYLGHTQHRWIELIQMSDITGAYGVSFAVACVAACVSELIPTTWLHRCRLIPEMEAARCRSAVTPRRMLVRGVCVGVLLASVIGYGYVRRAQRPLLAGPRVALVQASIPAVVDPSPQENPQIYQKHTNLTRLAVAGQADVIVWPEGMFRWPLVLTPEGATLAEVSKKHPQYPLERMHADGAVSRELNGLSTKAGAALVIGLTTIDPSLAKVRMYNSAQAVKPGEGLSARYDKMHRVPFGEYIPLAETLPFLKSFTPYADETGLAAGAKPVAFEHKGVRFASVICFEDTVPHVVRRCVRELNAEVDPKTGKTRKVDVLLNLSNDGWFHGSSEHDQHLITSVFRAVECRLPLARAANMGISAIIDSDGVIRKQAEDLETGRSKQIEAVVIADVPLDSRRSLYLAGGDWFAGLCLVCCLGFGVVGVAPRNATAAVPDAPSRSET